MPRRKPGYRVGDRVTDTETDRLTRLRCLSFQRPGIARRDYCRAVRYRRQCRRRSARHDPPAAHLSAKRGSVMTVCFAPVTFTIIIALLAIGSTVGFAVAALFCASWRRS
jgi:hypothetical protein